MMSIRAHLLIRPFRLKSPFNEMNDALNLQIFSLEFTNLEIYNTNFAQDLSLNFSCLLRKLVTNKYCCLVYLSSGMLVFFLNRSRL